MPIYEYRCIACGAKQERYQRKMVTQTPPRCVLCGGRSEKLMSACIFDLRGGGFFKNEYGDGAEKLGLKDQRRRLLRESDGRPGREIPPNLRSTFLTEISASNRDEGMYREYGAFADEERKKENKKKHEKRGSMK